MKAHAGRVLILMAVVGAAVGVGLREPLFTPWTPTAPPRPAPTAAVVRPIAPAPVPPSLEDVRRQARGRIQPHLDWADRECERAIAAPLQALDAFFAATKQHTTPFAEEVLGLGSKWRFVADRMPFTRCDRHDEFLRRAFGAHLFTPEQLEKEIRQAVKQYLDHVQGVENVMLVKIRADVSDLPPVLLLVRLDAAKLRSFYAEAMDRLGERTGASLREDVMQQVVAVIVAEVLTQAAVRLGVSAGILGAGSASASVTFGIGLVVGLIVDQIVSWVWDWWADPCGNLGREMDRKLDELHRAIVEGTPSAPGLRKRLEQFAQERAKARRKVVLELIEPVGGER